MTPTDFAKIPTPRSDAAGSFNIGIGRRLVDANLAQDLERELFIAESGLLAIWQFCATQSPESGIAQKCLRTLAEVRNTK